MTRRVRWPSPLLRLRRTGHELCSRTSSHHTLIAKIEEYLDAHNEDPKPFIWTATAQDISPKSPADE